MIVNKQITAVMEEIAKNATTLSNTRMEQYRYLRRFAQVFSKTLTEEERVYILAMMLEMLHYKNVMKDPATINELNNINMKNKLFMFMLFAVGVVLLGVVFKSNASLSGAVALMKGLFELFVI